MERRGIALLDMEPTAVADALERGEIDAGPISLLDIDRLTSQAELITGFCMASVNRAISCVLLSGKPIEDLGGSPIALSNPDPTSLQLLRVLFAQKHEIGEPTFVDRASDHDALLLTGNRALRGRRAERGFSHRYDLGEEWQTWTGLPFVFSRWMARTDLERQDFLIVQDALFVGQEDWMNNLYKDTGPRNDLLMLSREVLEYVQGLRFFMGVPEERAVALFQEKLSSLGTIST
jgi:chorismate dehydratase